MTPRLQLVRGNDYGFRLGKVATSRSQEVHFGCKFWARDDISDSLKGLIMDWWKMESVQ